MSHRLGVSLISLVVSIASAAELATPVSTRLSIISPLDYQVAQRLTRSEGKLVIAGNVALTQQKASAKTAALPDTLQARLTGKSLLGELPGQWQSLPFDSRVAAFRSELVVPPGGWYRLEVRALHQGAELARTTVEHVGIGEIFVIAGQSNSANYGEERQKTTSRLVAAFDGTTWQRAEDPQPGAGGSQGSFMPPFADAMVVRLRVPIGLVALGIGSTSVREWLPAGTLLTNLPPLTHNVITVGPGQWQTVGRIFSNFSQRMKQLGPRGFRAVLWHQGESDASQAEVERTLPGHLYRRYLEQLIRESRNEIGWDAPWFVAQASYHGPSDPGSPEIRAAQKALWDSGVALEGPDTDTLTGDLRDHGGNGVHLSGEGLFAHGRLWAAKVGPWLERQLGEAGQ